MLACAFTGNISGETTIPFGNILAEAMRTRLVPVGPKRADVSEFLHSLSACTDALVDRLWYLRSFECRRALYRTLVLT